MALRLKALLLAAGFGTRLRPITNSQPKCLVEIGGTPILGRWIHMLEGVGCESILINTHYLADQVHDYVGNIQARCKIELEIAYEESLLGTCGTLMANQSFFDDSTGLLIHADNATDADLGDLIKAHRCRPSHCLLTMLTFNTRNPEACGIVEVNSEGVAINFHEKIINPPSNRANGAIYVFDSEFLDKLKAMGPGVTDFSTQVIPEFLGQIYTWHTNSAYLDIGTPDTLAQAHKLWPNPAPLTP